MGASEKLTDDRMRVPSEWTFRDIDVAAKFDRHVREQLPWYDLVSGATAHFARHYIPEFGVVYDIGASTGNFGKLIEPALVARRAKLIPIEAAEEMAKMYVGPQRENLKIADATAFPFEEFDLAVCFLTIMFFPPAVRRKWIGELLGMCRVGGAVIIVDKLENPGGYFGTALHRLTIAGKKSTGTPAEEIIAKELSLPGAQRPLPNGFMEFAVPGGARQFFRFGEFAGWVIESPRG